MRTGMYLDSSDISRRLERLVNQSIPEEIEKGMGKAALQLLSDCTMQAPTVPLDEGTLRGSGSVFVQSRLKGVSRKYRGKGTPAVDQSDPVTRDTTVATVGFNTPYAARIHEGIGIRNWSEPSSGPKFLESKLIGNRREYMEILAESLRSAKK